jgi:hypothetical protein
MLSPSATAASFPPVAGFPFASRRILAFISNRLIFLYYISADEASREGFLLAKTGREVKRDV